MGKVSPVVVFPLNSFPWVFYFITILPSPFEWTRYFTFHICLIVCVCELPIGIIGLIEQPG